MAYSKAQLDRIGNLLVYITSKLGSIPKTKLLKLIYIIEEESVKKAGVPFTDLSYTYLPLGPVSTFVNTQIEKNRDFIQEYINIERAEGKVFISPKVDFNDDEFSEFDLEIMDDVLHNFGQLNSKNLIDYTHRPGSPWKLLDDEYDGKMPPNSKRDLDLMKVLDSEGVDEDLRKIAKEEKAFLDYLMS